MENDASSSQTTISSSPSLTPSPEKPKPQRGAIIAIVILAVLAIGGLAFGGYEFYLNKQQATSAENIADAPSSTPEAASTKNVPAGTTSSIASTADDEEVLSLLEEIKSTLDSAWGSSWGYVTTYNYDNPTYNPNQDNLYILLEKSYGIFLRFGDSQNPREKTTLAAQALDTFFESKGYVKTFSSLESMLGDVYTNRQIVCSNDAGRTTEVVVSCSETSWYSKEKLALATELAAAFGIDGIDYPLTVNVNGAKIEDSTISPYQKITVAINNGAALFYRSSPDSDWVFVVGTQGIPECSAFDEEARKAFSGMHCFDTANGAETTL